MPDFSILYQRSVAPTAPDRLPRGRHFTITPGTEPVTEAIVIGADTLPDALEKAMAYFQKATPALPRIISIEERLPVEKLHITDARLTEVLTAEESEIDPDDYTDVMLGRDDDFAELIEKVCQQLDQHQIVAGLACSLLHNGDGWVDYLMLEVLDEATRVYRGVGAQPHELLDNPDAVGWDAVLSLARGIITTVSVNALA